MFLYTGGYTQMIYNKMNFHYWCFLLLFVFFFSFLYGVKVVFPDIKNSVKPKRLFLWLHLLAYVLQITPDRSPSCGHPNTSFVLTRFIQYEPRKHHLRSRLGCFLTPRLYREVPPEFNSISRPGNNGEGVDGGDSDLCPTGSLPQH